MKDNKPRVHCTVCARRKRPRSGCQRPCSSPPRTCLQRGERLSRLSAERLSAERLSAERLRESVQTLRLRVLDLDAQRVSPGAGARGPGPATEPAAS
eukprot:2842487-Rhodomonas_salina.3